MQVLDKYIAEISTLCVKHKVKQLYVFGSALNNNLTEVSDVDLIVNFKEIDLHDYADNYYQLKYSLEELLKYPVDLLEQQAIKNPYFLKQVKSQQQLIYGWYFNVNSWFIDSHVLYLFPSVKAFWN